MRRLGVYGANLPTKSERSVVPADFSVAGLYGRFCRKYNRAFRFRNTQEALTVLGPQSDPSSYGWDALNGFFANLSGEQGSVYVAAFPGVGAVQAFKNVNDQQAAPEPTLKLSAAYQGEDEYGAAANRTGFKITGGAAFSSAVGALPSANLKVITLESVTGIRPGDVARLYKTGYSEYHIVASVDESARTVAWSDADYAGTGAAADYTFEVRAFKVQTYLKDSKGVVSEVDRDLGKAWCTLNASDPDRYVEAVLAQGSYLKATKVAVTGTPTAAQVMPADVADVTYLESGSDGTQPGSLAEWQAVYAMLDSLPVRLVANVETSNSGYQSALEAYCANRDDKPVAMLVGQQGMSTKAQATAAGQSFQRSNEVDATFVHNWVGVPDPFATSQSAPKRAVPPAGHLMGWWLSSVARDGVHVIPARRASPLKGVSEAYGYAAESDQDRTDLAAAGVNVIQRVAGYGFLVRNLFTPSTAPEFKYSNAVLMRNYIKASVVDSLQASENSPNDIGSVREDRMAVLQFMNRLWARGSTGNVKEGETFGRYELEDGSLSSKDDAFEVVADASNNSVASLQMGERNVDLWFMFPAPAGSIRVGVGLIYKVQ